ncbi:MAG TPA: bifunctional riboflavin kinase/FAD synthetase [Bryobacteraceae bacterium]|nr:bifunctional riboflavin kinase/FAD synthetase [Bryobacteraceae bacterium]
MSQVFYSLPTQDIGPCALAIGNFDGVHAGHKALLRTMAEYATHHNVPIAALTFDPHPAAIVAPERLPKMICTVPERIELLQQAGAERVVVLPFTRELSQQTPREFAEHCLVQGLHARAVFVGENFRFGHKQAGDTTALAKLGRELGFETSFLPPVVIRREIVSSSRIRRHLRANEVEIAGRLLDRCFSLKGPVIPGHGIGSKQTVPTLNIPPTPGLVQPLGVFVSETIDSLSGRRWASITNVGNRPTFGGEDITIETFLLDPFTGDPPSEIEVRFRHFVRAEKKFETAEELKKQILADAAHAQAYWRRTRRWTNVVRCSEEQPSR